MAFRRLFVRCVGLVPVACGATLLPILPHGGAPDLPNGTPLEVTAHAAAAVDPMTVSGSSVAYGDVGPALREAVVSETRSFIEKHPTAGEFSLSVELIDAEATYARDRFGVSLVARATLRRRSGNAFVGQTQAVCRESKIISPSNGAPVVYRCMLRIGRTLGGWLEDVAP